MDSLINNKVLLLIFMCCSASLDLLGMHHQQSTDHMQQHAQLEPLTLENLCKAVPKYRVKNGVVMGDVIITVEEGDFRRIRIIKGSALKTVETNESIPIPNPITKECNESLFEIACKSCRLTGNVHDFYKSIQPNNFIYLLMKIKKIDHIVKEKFSMEEAASLIKALIIDKNSDKSEMFSLEEQGIINDEDKCFAYFVYAMLYSPLDFDSYFSTVD